MMAMVASEVNTAATGSRQHSQLIPGMPDALNK
jgi:hypothetical protein